MSAAPITISIYATLELAEKIFAENRFTALPVVDQRESIVGVLTDFILVKLFLHRASIKSANKSGLNLLYFQDKLDPIATIEEDEPITNAFKVMSQSPNHRVFVTKEGKLSGALSPKDVIPLLAGGEARAPQHSSDMTEAQKRINELLSELESERLQHRNYSSFFDNAPVMMHAVDFNGNLVMANKMLHTMLGYEPNEIIGLPYMELYPYQLRNQVEQSLYLIKTTGYNPLISTMMVKKDKSLLKVEMASMLRKENGIPVTTISVSRPSELSNILDYLRLATAAEES